jgi:hypothetical protein
MPDSTSLVRTKFCTATVLACGFTNTKAEFLSASQLCPSDAAAAAAEDFRCHVNRVAVAQKSKRSVAMPAMVTEVLFSKCRMTRFEATSLSDGQADH